MSEIVIGRSSVRMDTDAETAIATEAWESLKKEVGVEEATSFLNECSTVFGQREFNAFEFCVCCDLIMRFNAVKTKKKERMRRNERV